MLRNLGGQDTGELIVVENFFGELKAKGGEQMISELRIQNGELRILHPTPHSQLSTLNSKF